MTYLFSCFLNVGKGPQYLVHYYKFEIIFYIFLGIAVLLGILKNYELYITIMPTNEFNLDMKLSIDLFYATLYIMY